MPTTTNMGLSLPSVSVTPGPQWASLVNSAFDSVDQHDHTTGKGVKVPVSGMNFNSDVDIAGYSLKSAKSARFSNQSPALSGAANYNSVFVSGNELFYNDSAGNSIQLTLAGAINVASIGAITGLASPGSASFNTSTGIFTWIGSTISGAGATMEMGQSRFFANGLSGGFGAYLTAAPTMSADYTIRLPAAMPSSKGLVAASVSSATVSQQEYVYPDNATIQESAGVLSVKTITDSNLVDNTISPRKILQPNYYYGTNSTYYAASPTSEYAYVSVSTPSAGVPIVTGRRYQLGVRPFYFTTTNNLFRITLSNAGATGNYGKFYIKTQRPSGTMMYWGMNVYCDAGTSVNVPPMYFDDFFPEAGTYNFSFCVILPVATMSVVIQNLNISVIEG